MHNENQNNNSKSQLVPTNGISIIGDGTLNKNEKKKGLSLISGATFIVGEMAGGGILTLSSAMAETSWSGIFVLILCCFNAGYAGIYLSKCWLILEDRWPEYRTHVRKPFATIGDRACGKWMKILVSITMNITLFGGSTVFLLICAQIVSILMKDVTHNLTQCDWAPILAAILTPLMWLGSPADFWPAAYSAMGATIIGSILLLINIIIEAPNHVSLSNFLSDDYYAPPSLTSFFLSFGKILFAYGGACAFPSFQNDMKDKKQFPSAVLLAHITLLILYLPISIGGYVVYGSKVAPNILSSISDGVLLKVIESCFAVHLFFAFLIVINPVVLEIEELFKIPNRFGWKRIVLRTVLMLCSLFLGESVPKFDKILDFIGGSTGTLMTFIMPPLFYYKLMNQKSSQWPEKKIPLIVKIILLEIMIIGICGGIASTYSAVKDLFESSTFAPPCYVKKS